MRVFVGHQVSNNPCINILSDPNQSKDSNDPLLAPLITSLLQAAVNDVAYGILPGHVIGVEGEDGEVIVSGSKGRGRRSRRGNRGNRVSCWSERKGYRSDFSR